MSHLENRRLAENYSMIVSGVLFILLVFLDLGPTIQEIFSTTEKYIGFLSSMTLGFYFLFRLILQNTIFPYDEMICKNEFLNSREERIKEQIPKLCLEKNITEAEARLQLEDEEYQRDRENSRRYDDQKDLTKAIGDLKNSSWKFWLFCLLIIVVWITITFW